MWIVHGARFGAHTAGVPIVDVATMSVAVVPVFKALVWHGGVIRTLVCCSRLWIHWFLRAPTSATAAAVTVAMS